MKVSAVFDWAGDGPKVSGVHDPSQRWNGWACPSFSLEAVQGLAAWIDAQPAEMQLERIKVEDGRVFYGCPFDAEGRVIVDIAAWRWTELPADEQGLYPVGAWGWTWSEVE